MCCKMCHIVSGLQAAAQQVMHCCRLMAEQVRLEDFKAAEDVMRSVLLLALGCGALVTGILQVCIQEY